MPRRVLEVFLASPGDVQIERDAFKATVEELNSRRTDVLFKAVGWEDVRVSTGVRPQDLINQLVDRCQVFVLLMHRAWGRRAVGSATASSYTEEEFNRAVARFNHAGAPEIACFFKQVDLDALADPGPQLIEVLRFRQRLEASNQVLYRTFDTTDEFKSVLADYLEAWVDGRLPAAKAAAPRQLLLSVPEDNGASPDDWDAAAVLVDQAALAARDGRMDEATMLFAEVSQQTTDLRLLTLAEEFFRRRGELITALCVADKRLVLTRDRRRAALEYIAAAPSLAEQVAANALPHLPEESHAEFLRIVAEVFGPEFRHQAAGYLAEHLTVPELLALAKFYRGEGKSIADKAGRYMGDSIPRAMAQVQKAIERLG